MTITPLWTRSFCLLTLSHLLGALGYASMLLLPLYLAFLGGSRTEIGMVMASANIAGLLTRPFVGWSLDRFGRRYSLILGGVLTALSLVGVYFINSVDITAFSVRILFGIGEGFIFTGYFAFAADLIPPHRRTEGLALFGVAGLLPLLVNPIADITGFQGGDLRVFLSGVSILVLLSALLVLLIPKQEGRRAGDRSNNEKSESERLATDKSSKTTNTVQYLLASRLRPLWWSTIAFAGAVSLMMTFASVIGSTRGITYPTSVWFTYVAGAVFARLFGAKLPEKIGPARLVAPSLALYGFALLIYALFPQVSAMLISGLLAGIAHGYCFPVLTSLVVSAVSESYRGRALAMFTGTWGGAAVLIAPLAGKIADSLGDEQMLFIFAGLLFFATLYAKPSRFQQSL